MIKNMDFEYIVICIIICIFFYIIYNEILILEIINLLYKKNYHLLKKLIKKNYFLNLIFSY